METLLTCVFPGPNPCRRSRPSCVRTGTRSTSSPTVAPPSASSASSSPYCPPPSSASGPGWASGACPRPWCLCPPSPASWRSPRASDGPPSDAFSMPAPLSLMSWLKKLFPLPLLLLFLLLIIIASFTSTWFSSCFLGRKSTDFVSSY